MNPQKRLNKLLNPKLIDDAKKVYATATYYPDFIRVYWPFKPYEKLLPGMEKRKYSNSHGERTELEKLMDSERSLRRTKKSIRDFVHSNRFELFATFTFKSDRQNTDRTKAKMNNWLKNQKRRKGKFEYLIVPEFHKDQQSLHFHALLKGYKGRLNKSINPKTNEQLRQNGRKVYTLPGYTLGFSNVKKIDNDPESYAKLGNYVTKYITKDMPLFFGKNRYWASRNLKTPLVVENPINWYEQLTPISFRRTDYGIILYFKNDSSQNFDLQYENDKDLRP